MTDKDIAKELMSIENALLENPERQDVKLIDCTSSVSLYRRFEPHGEINDFILFMVPAVPITALTGVGLSLFTTVDPLINLATSLVTGFISTGVFAGYLIWCEKKSKKPFHDFLVTKIFRRKWYKDTMAKAITFNEAQLELEKTAGKRLKKRNKALKKFDKLNAQFMSRNPGSLLAIENNLIVVRQNKSQHSRLEGISRKIEPKAIEA